MKRQIEWMVYGIMLLLSVGCREDVDALYGVKSRPGIPVCFTTAWPQDVAGLKRGIADKKDFKEADVIHVSAEFTLDPLTTESQTEEKVTKYTILTLENGAWVNTRTEEQYEMTWPWNAKEAKFTAYYLENWTGPIAQVGVELEPVVLDRFAYRDSVFNPDPLEAVTEKVEYGHAVHLAFHHLCTRLTLVGVDDEDEYGLRFKPVGGVERSLQNACTMKLDEKNRLHFRFVEEESRQITAQVDDEGGEKSVTFHLAPGDYSTFSLLKRSEYAYITISDVQELGELKAGESYTVSLEDLKSNITPDDGDNWWDDKDDPTVEKYNGFNVKDFMNAIKECNKDYTCTLYGDTVTLLQKNKHRNEMKLMANVDFNGESFIPEDLPDIVTFNGGGFSILNLVNPMFNTLYGTVENLNLRGARLIHKESDPDASLTVDHDTGWGVLARVCEGGTVSNVSLADAELDITLHNGDGLDKAYCIGALVGKLPRGSLTDIMLSGSIKVTAEAANPEAAYTSCMGGVVGQCNGTLANVDNLRGGSGAEIVVTNKCRGTGSRYTGGVVGLLTDANGALEGGNVRVSVHAEEAEGSWNYTGGVAGGVRFGALISDVTVAGNVTGGKVADYKETNTHSAVGGLVGYVDKASVTGGIAFGKVAMSPDYPSPNDHSWYTLGGVIGAMRDAVEIARNEGRNRFDTAPYEGKSHYEAGTFTAGSGSTSELKGKGNSADGTGAFVGSDK
ncbi:fimbrillin family protein [Paraprevotella clara]|uniref:fimbrillin family protein n=1 Tax=Paraprevotella clara TaxID=454154 RepID=UPI0040274E1E